MLSRCVLTLLSTCLLLAATATAESEGFVHVSGMHFRDGAGRQLIPHGMAVINKSKAEGYTSWHTEADFERMRDWGMNCIRLGIIWDGLEPEPGKYDEAYLKRIDAQIAMAKRQGLYVFLDMHQDLFSVQYSDGAPPWATLSGGKQHLSGPVWSDSYLISPAVQQSFDSFWADAPAPDGIGIQEHYVRLWRMLADRYKDETAILGFDLMNEPFMGSSVNTINPVLLASPFAAMAVARLEGKVSQPEDLLAMWLTPEGRETIMGLMEDKELYAAFVDAHTEICGAFEREHLMPMFQRIAHAIREVNPRHILLLETNYHANMGVYSAIEPLKLKDGSRDPQVAYAPHAYDIVVDTPALSKANFGRLEVILGRHGETAQRLNMPLLIGEWGAFGDAGKGVLPGAEFVVRQFERLQAGDTYWEYGKYVENSAYLRVLQRPMPLAVCGTLTQYSFDPETGRFECDWIDGAETAGPTRIYVPAWLGADETNTNLDPHVPRVTWPEPGKPAATPAPGIASMIRAVKDSKNLYWEIPSTGEGNKRGFVVKGKPEKKLQAQ
ncbi:MAG: cellulase family glycosylhydrolase [Candidatus Hydrogenedentes bacterium]|nr:cellulase family glycosylhydrolase [Candidatus Hydrogenedentota bacterium]